jgi:hypothetical protein
VVCFTRLLRTQTGRLEHLKLAIAADIS